LFFFLRHLGLQRVRFLPLQKRMN